VTTTAVSATTSETVSATTTETVSATTWVSAGDDESEVLRPVNMVVLVGQSIVLPCSSRADGDSRWDFYAYDTNRPQRLYSGSGAQDTTGRRVHVDLSLCRLKTCPVDIASLQVRDAGYYVCFDVSRPERVGAALVALGINYLHSCEPVMLSTVPCLH